MPSPYQVATSTSNAGISYPPQQHIVTLADGSLLVAYYDGGTSVKLVQITNPSGTSPTMTTLAQSFSIAGSGATIGSLHVLNNGTTSSDVWLAYADNSGSTATLFVAHGTYTASGASWSWDNTGTSIALGSTYNQGFMIPSVCWTGTYLIVAARAFDTSSSYATILSYTTTKSGSTGWAAVFAVESSTGGSHNYPILLHDATTGCTLLIYTVGGDTVYARVLPDSSSPALANWSAHVALSGTVNVGAANLTAVLDPANSALHVAWHNSGASPNPNYVKSTYTTTSISAGTSYTITGGGGTGATGPTLGFDNASPPNVYLFWASAAPGAASDVSYVKIASPYASGNVSGVTNLTNASTNDNAMPHLPQQQAMSGYVALLYIHTAVSPYAIEFDNSISLASSVHLSGVCADTGTLAGALTPPAVALSGVAADVGTLSGSLTPVVALRGVCADTGTLAGALTAPAVHLAGTAADVGTLSGSLIHGTGPATLSVATQSYTWSGGPGGSPGNGTQVISKNGSGDGTYVAFIPTYGGAGISPFGQVDAGTLSANQTGMTTTVPDGHIHWLEQTPSGYSGSEDNPFTLTELGPTGTSFRRYYKASFGPDANGFDWNVYACIYPGDPLMIAYRFDCINPSGSTITLAGGDGMEVALIGGLQQSDSTWTPGNGFYGQVGGSTTTGWPSALTAIDPDFVGITPAAGGAINIGVVTVKQQRLAALSPLWSNAQIQYLQNAARLKVKVQGDIASFPASATQTLYFLNVLRRALTATDAAAMAADYLAPGTPTTTVGSYTSWSYDEALHVFAASAAPAVTLTLDMSPLHISVRYKPRLKITGWNGALPLLSWGGSALVAGTDFQYYADSAGHALYLQLAFDVVASGATTGQRNNAALAITATPTVALSGTPADTGTLAGALTAPAVALVATVADTGALSGVITPPGVHPSGAIVADVGTLAGALTAPAAHLTGVAADSGTLAGALTPPAVHLAATSADTGTLSGTLTPPAVALSGVAADTGTLAGTLTPPPVHLSATCADVGTLSGALSFAITLSGIVADTGTLAGALTPAPVHLAGVCADTGALAGALTPPALTLAATCADTGTLSGALRPPLANLAGIGADVGTLTGALTPPAARLTGIAPDTGTLVGALTPPRVALAATCADVGTLSGFLGNAAHLSGVCADIGALSGALTTPAVLLIGIVADTGRLTGQPTPPGVHPSGAIAADVGSVAGALTPPRVLLIGIVADSGRLGGALGAPRVALIGIVADVGTLTGALHSGPRHTNETTPTEQVLAALSVILPLNTQLSIGAAAGAGSGTIAINDESALALSTNRFPSLLIMEGPQETARIAARLWQKKLTVFVFYLADWTNTPETDDAIWAGVNADMERMIANITDNPTLTCTLPGGSGPTRNCLEAVALEPSPRTQRVIDDRTYGRGRSVVQRMLTLKVNLPPYVSLA